jgi:transposase
MVKIYRRNTKRKRRVTLGSNGWPVNLHKLSFKDELRIECELLEFWYENPNLSYRQSSGDEGRRNGAPHKISKSSLQRLVKWFEWYGEPKSLTGVTLGGASGRKKLTYEQQLALKALVLEKPELYLDEIQSKLINLGFPKIHPSTIYKYLKRIGLSLNSLTAVASERSELERSQYYKEILGLDPHMFIFMDETAKDRKASRRRRGWTKTGSDSKIAKRFIRTADRFTLLAAMNINGFIPHACMKVDRDEDTVDGDLFEYYLESTLLPVMGNFLRGEPNSILIIDNASIHNHNHIRNMVEAVGAKVIFTARYSPDINPIEYAFHMYKSLLKRLSEIEGEERAHIIALGSITKKKLLPIFQKCFPDYNFHINMDDYNENVRKVLIDNMVEEIMKEEYLCA